MEPKNLKTMVKPTVLITGCSDDGLGSALALELHAHGHRVFATARSLSKLSDVQAAGIETILLDVTSDASIEQCVAEVRQLTGGSLDMLVNNAGGQFATALADAPIPQAKQLFDLNLWSNLAMIQAFLPLLLRSTRGGTIVNHTSTSSVMVPPFISLYGASKAAFAMLTDALRHELSPFGITVVELKSGSTASNINQNQGTGTGTPGVPKTSLYYPARKWLDHLYTGAPYTVGEFSRERWAREVVAGLSKRNPPRQIWVGAFTWTIWLASWLPHGMAQKLLADAAKVDVVTAQLREYGTAKAIADVYGEAG